MTDTAIGNDGTQPAPTHPSTGEREKPQEVQLAKQDGARRIPPRAKLGLVLALLAAGAAWGFVQARHPVFVVSSEYDIGMGAPIAARVALAQQQALAELKNSTLNTAVIGASLAIALALAAPACCGALGRVLAAAPFGAIWGAATGYLGATIYQTLIPTSVMPTVGDTAQAQGIFFALLGLGAGLLYGAFCGSWYALLVGALAGVLAGGGGGIAYPILAAVVMASQSTEGLIPDAGSVRLLWLGLPFACMGFVIPSILAGMGRSKGTQSEVQALEHS